LNDYDIDIIIHEEGAVQFFEDSLRYANSGAKGGEALVSPKVASNWLTSTLFGLLGDDKTLVSGHITPNQFGEFQFDYLIEDFDPLVSRLT